MEIEFLCCITFSQGETKGKETLKRNISSKLPSICLIPSIQFCFNFESVLRKKLDIENENMDGS